MQSFSTQNLSASMPLSQGSSVQWRRRQGDFLRYKVIHDRVHDQVSLHPLLIEIIDTPQFQRLRDIRQLGNVHYIFPGAVHTRFEHCIGVSFLARKFLLQLKANHAVVGPALGITEQDELCVSIAGLCHDLGHGPLSHVFEGFVSEVRRQKGITKMWHHEEAGIELLDFLLISNKIHLPGYGLNAEDLTFIKQLIVGLPPHAAWPRDNGRPPSKRFLFDIVCNKRNGIDVDKFDYFLRDSLSCYGQLPGSVPVERFFNCARVIEYNGEPQICFEEKVALSLGDMFSLRAKLHKYIYQHRVVLVLDRMVLEALLAAEGHFTIPGSNGGSFSLSETVNDMEAFSKTGDWILNSILMSTSPDLETSRSILQQIRRRELYRFAGSSGLRASRWSLTARDIHAFLPNDVKESIPLEDLCIFVARIVYGSSGSKPGDPVNNIRFFNPKLQPNVAFELNRRRMSPLFSPREFEETTAFVFTRNPEFAEHAAEALRAWKKRFRTRVVEHVSFSNSSPTPGTKRPRAIEIFDDTTSHRRVPPPRPTTNPPTSDFLHENELREPTPDPPTPDFLHENELREPTPDPPTPDFLHKNELREPTPDPPTPDFLHKNELREPTPDPPDSDFHGNLTGHSTQTLEVPSH